MPTRESETTLCVVGILVVGSRKALAVQKPLPFKGQRSLHVRGRGGWEHLGRSLPCGLGRGHEAGCWKGVPARPSGLVGPGCRAKGALALVWLVEVDPGLGPALASRPAPLAITQGEDRLPAVLVLAWLACPREGLGEGGGEAQTCPPPPWRSPQRGRAEMSDRRSHPQEEKRSIRQC